jgi:hypothetical protein
MRFPCSCGRRSGCGVALVSRFLAEEELSAGQLVIPWPFSLASRAAYYLAYPEHKVETTKVKGFKFSSGSRCCSTFFNAKCLKTKSASSALRSRKTHTDAQ